MKKNNFKLLIMSFLATIFIAGCAVQAQDHHRRLPKHSGRGYYNNHRRDNNSYDNRRSRDDNHHDDRGRDNNRYDDRRN